MRKMYVVRRLKDGMYLSGQYVTNHSKNLEKAWLFDAKDPDMWVEDDEEAVQVDVTVKLHKEKK